MNGGRLKIVMVMISVVVAILVVMVVVVTTNLIQSCEYPGQEQHWQQG